MNPFLMSMKSEVLKNKLCMYETRIESLEDQLMVAKAAVDEKDEKCDQMWRS